MHLLISRNVVLAHPFNAGQHSAVGSTSDSRASGPGFYTQYGHILSFLLSLIQGGQLSVTGESMYQVLVNCLGGVFLPAQEKCG